MQLHRCRPSYWFFRPLRSLLVAGWGWGWGWSWGWLVGWLCASRVALLLSHLLSVSADPSIHLPRRFVLGVSIREAAPTLRLGSSPWLASTPVPAIVSSCTRCDHPLFMRLRFLMDVFIRTARSLALRTVSSFNRRPAVFLDVIYRLLRRVFLFRYLLALNSEVESVIVELNILIVLYMLYRILWR